MSRVRIFINHKNAEDTDSVTGPPMMHSMCVFDALEPKFTPFKFILCVELTLWLAGVGCVYSLKPFTMVRLKKLEQFPPCQTQVLLSVAVTLVAVSCCQLSYIPYVSRHCDLLVLKIIILNKCQEKKLKIEKDSSINCHSKGFVMKVKLLWLFFHDQKSMQHVLLREYFWFCLNSHNC